MKTFGQEQKYTALCSYSVQAYVCPTSCPSKNSAFKKCMSPLTNPNPEECEYHYISYVSFISVFCNRIIKGSQNFDGLVCCIVKFSSIIQIHYSTLTFIFILIQSYIKNILPINQNVSIGSF